MNKLNAVLYFILLVFEVMGRFVCCFMEAALQSRFLSWSHFVEVFKFMWTDTKHYTPVAEHWENIKNEWKTKG